MGYCLEGGPTETFWGRKVEHEGGGDVQNDELTDLLFELVDFATLQ